MRTTADKMQWLASLPADEISPTAFQVAFALANCLNTKTTLCNPSKTMIADMIKVSPRTVQRALIELQKGGFIAVAERGNGRGNRQKYVLIKGDIKGDKRETSLSSFRTERETNLTVKGDKSVAPIKEETVKETVKENKQAKKVSRFSYLPDGVSRSVADEFIQHRKNLKAPLTAEGYKRAMNAAVKAANELNITADAAIQEAIDAGWRGIKTDWLKNRLRKVHETNQRVSRRQHHADMSAEIDRRAEEAARRLGNAAFREDEGDLRGEVDRPVSNIVAINAGGGGVGRGTGGYDRGTDQTGCQRVQENDDLAAIHCRIPESWDW